MSRQVDESLAAALGRAAPFADELLLSGVHPDGSHEDRQPLKLAQELAETRLSDDDDQRFRGVINTIEHAYVLGIAVGLRLRPPSSPEEPAS